MIPPRPALGLLAAAALLGACAGAPPTPAPAHPAAAPGVAPPPPAGQAQPLEPAGAPSYGREPALAPSPLEADAMAAASARFTRGGPPPARAASLVLAARELARLAADGDAAPLARGRVRTALWRALAIDPAPAAHLVTGPRAKVIDALVAILPPRGAATHLGAGAVERDGVVHLVLLASERRARLDPVPRDVAPGVELRLSGELLGGLADPRLFVTRPSGGVEEVEVQGSRRFAARLAFPGAGRHVVEVVGRGMNGPEVAALLAVSAGGAPLDQPAAAPAPASASRDPEDAASAEARVLAAINATRRRHGLPPFAAAPELQALARRHSADMLAQGILAHVLPGSGELGTRLQRARVPFRRALENVAKGQSALAAHEAAEESPAHRENLLSREATRAGVGVARGTLPAGDPVVYLTEIFVEPPDDGADDRLTPEARVRQALWSERARLGQPPLTADPRLEELAREAAAAMRQGEQPDARRLTDRAVALGRGVAAADAFVASAPADAVRSHNLGDGRFTRVGVGVAVGDSPRWGAGRLFIAVVYSDEPRLR